MQTVISVFETPQQAQRTLDRLVQEGIDRDNVHVEQGQTTSMSDSSTTTARAQDADEDRGVLSSIGHFFASLFGQDDDNGARQAGVYSEAVRRGSSVVVVDVIDEQEAERVTVVMHELGAIDVDERAQEWRQGGWTGDMNQPVGQTTMSNAQPTLGAERATARDMTGETASQPGRDKMEVVQEELQVGKRNVDRGGVRVIQRVSEKPVRELLKLREERAVVERNPVDREATAEDLSNFREGTVEVRETSEEPVVAKRARVVEEVRVGKEVKEREQAIEDTVRRKDVDIERIEGQGGRTERERAVASDIDRDSPTPRDPDATSDRGTLTGDSKPTGKPRKNP
jgi:uncharacterized protein (TIGR02271 family)